ncbi:response regulator receiver domain-containing protein [Vreelandella songnenensis]|uniref:Response regulator receiver domain-containing protein n=1 Tax=Vreelandella songnenensis TaxID=1176243 RepID=A0A2T0V1W5_9GAMM|nr:response regulator [Halomonas songnenensis]PRY64179.1 response regulator receiver domain-containing protein [Halomonas songnenensis]
MRILVVDDDSLAGEITAAYLEALGHEPVIALDAMEAASQLDTLSDIALIVSDMHMPLINGLALLEMLREQGITLPFILLTGDEPPTNATQQPGLTACLQKSADLDVTLAHAIEQAFKA